MTDEELAAKVAEDTKVEEVPVDPPVEPSKEEPPKDEPLKEEEPETPAEEVPPDEEPEDTPAAPSRREQLRVEDLLRKYGPPKDSSKPKPAGKDYREMIDADDQVIKDLESDRQQSNQQSFDQGLERAQYYQWETLLRVDEPQVRSKFPALDPTSKEYHPAIRRAMDAKYAALTGYDPGDPDKGVPSSVRNHSIRYLDMVESEMEFSEELASLKVEATTKNIAKQTAQTALRPDGSSAKKLDLNKKPEDMTLEELKARVAL